MVLKIRAIPARLAGKELEENGFGVVLDKKRARPFRAPPIVSS